MRNSHAKLLGFFKKIWPLKNERVALGHARFVLISFMLEPFCVRFCGILRTVFGSFVFS